MSKNAFVLRMHANGQETFVENTVVLDMTNERFDALAKQNLVREATEAEVKASSEKSAEAPANKAAPTSPNKAAPETKKK